uniref:Uncharacterized protein n=1 Tax=Cannabis sativa TaxID=3483 RepID=A0A803QPK5_CANSA
MVLPRVANHLYSGDHCWCRARVRQRLALGGQNARRIHQTKMSIQRVTLRMALWYLPALIVVDLNDEFDLEGVNIKEVRVEVPAEGPQQDPALEAVSKGKTIKTKANGKEKASTSSPLFIMMESEKWTKTLTSFLVKRVSNLSLHFKIREPVPRTPESEELKKKLALYDSMTNQDLKVEGLVTTKLLREHRLIARFQSVDSICSRGLSYANWRLRNKLSSRSPKS